MHIQIDLNKKTTGYFHPNYGHRAQDWNNQGLLDGLGWHERKNVFHPNEDGVFDDDILHNVRVELSKLVLENSSYIYQAFLVRDDGPKVPICPPLTNTFTTSEEVRRLVFTNLPTEPEYVAGEEEEEFLLYRSAP